MYYSLLMKNIKKVSILGCGWVGSPLKALLETKGHTVYCLSHDIEHNISEHFYDVDVLIIAIPPSVQGYLNILEDTFSYLKRENHTQVIFLSSISYYDAKASVVEAETLVKNLLQDVVILRLGGLMGYDRIAGKYTAGKVLNSDSRTNYVHRDDILEIIESVIKKNICTEIFDVVAPIQSTKKVIFAQNAEMFGFKHTQFLEGNEVGKMLFPIKLCEILDYAFQKPNVLTFWN